MSCQHCQIVYNIPDTNLGSSLNLEYFYGCYTTKTVKKGALPIKESDENMKNVARLIAMQTRSSSPRKKGGHI
jgi:hypothetical protein